MNAHRGPAAAPGTPPPAPSIPPAARRRGQAPSDPPVDHGPGAPRPWDRGRRMEAEDGGNAVAELVLVALRGRWEGLLSCSADLAVPAQD